VRFSLPEPNLTDGIVELRPWTPADVPALVAALDGDPVISVWLDQVPQPFTEDNGARFVDGSNSRWAEGAQASFALVDAATDELLGSAGAHGVPEGHDAVEIDYWVADAGRGRGAATRAAVLVSRWAIEALGAQRVQLRADVENVGSCRVAEKAGFVREGVIRSIRRNERQGGRRIDWALYSLLPDDLP
jgi:RimJ/RimL family protein N-acetyltransferase